MMEEVRQLVQEEGREARNLVAFHVAVDTPSRISRKPPRAGPPPRRSTPRPAARLRSASAGRDKRSELRARYWALLFGDLQRAVGEIYNTVEAHENLNECQEVILVLENYTRDFKSLCEWFRLKWEYDNTPPPQRPQSLAWEIRKTDFVRPESRRTHSVKSSPSVSGKNSPCLSGSNTPSGKNSPSLTGKASPGSGKISPRNSGHSNTSPKPNIDIFSSKINLKSNGKSDPKAAKEVLRLSDIKEKEIIDNLENRDILKDLTDTSNDKGGNLNTDKLTVEIGQAKECSNISPKMVVIKSPKRLLARKDDSKPCNDSVFCHAKATIAKLEEMENQFLAKQITENEIKHDNQRNIERESDNIVLSDGALENPVNTKENIDDKEESPTESPVKSDDNFADVSNESSSKSSENEYKFPSKQLEQVEENHITQGIHVSVPMVNSKSDLIERKSDLSLSDNCLLDANKEMSKREELNSQLEIKEGKKEPKHLIDKLPPRPAYSQAAAKPKTVTTVKSEPKYPTRIISRSKTVVEIRSNVFQKQPQRNDARNRNQINKCSYPFNLTTGRSNLFHAPNRPAPKRPINRMQQMGSGDNRTTVKSDVQTIKRPCRPTSLNVNEKGDKKENNKSTLSNVKDCSEYGSSDTLVSRLDLSRIESSESLKTLVPEGADVGNTLELLNVDNTTNDEGGWLTVKSRRLSRESKKQSKSHWSNRFHQPTATTSLPTLNMMESPKQEVREIVSSINLDRSKSEQPQKNPALSKELEEVDLHEVQKTQQISNVKEILKPQEICKREEFVSQRCSDTKDMSRQDEMPKTQEISYNKYQEASTSNPVPDAVASTSKSVSTDTKKDLSIIRQKSDVTGLKTRSSKSRALKKEKVKDTPKDLGSELTKNRLHSSLESLTTGLARSQESTNECFDFDQWKIEFKSTLSFLEDDDQMPNHNEILKTADPSEMSEIAEMTSQIEENEKKISWALDFQSEMDQKKLCEEEDLLNRQILELQQVSDIDLDTETDDTETDAEILCEDVQPIPVQSTESDGSLKASLEDQYETALAGMSWAERIDALGALEELVARDPGRAQQLHAKLSQGIKRRGSLQDALRRLQAKQARAHRQRMEYQTERARKIHQLLGRVEEVKVAKNQLIEEKRLRMERRLQKAAENRDQHLKDIVRKAHDEEEKLREIAFIKQLEAENRRHEFLDQCRTHTTRLRQMRRDRLHKLEQKAAREAAVGARRQALEAARRLHVETLVERRKERDARVEELKEQKKQERGDAAREKAEGVKSRLSALAAAAELEADALRSRIRDKQDASQQRLESHLQAIREKATGPRQTTSSESHDQSTKEEREMEEEARRLEQERKDRDKQKAIKKKARKVKQKLLTTSQENLMVDDTLTTDMLPHNTRTCKVIQQIQNIIAPLIYAENKENEQEGEEVDKNKNDTNIQNADVENKSENNNNKEIDGQEARGESNKKKKKVNHERNERPQLRKSGSVCSSYSDRSRSSGQVERPRDVINTKHLEKLLNELYRMIEKVDRSVINKSTIHKLLIIKVLGVFLAVAAERDDLASQISTKSLTTTVVILSGIIGSCAISSSYFVTTNISVHIVKLLCNQLDKKLQSEQKELELAKQLCDCLSVAMDAVLCSTRLTENSKDVPAHDMELLGTVRARVHTLISYICLCGCISRAEKSGEVRENIQTLLTVCAELCYPSEMDDGPERASATQSLRCALGTSVCGSRAEFCLLFAQGAGLEHSGGFVKAARTAHLLRSLAELDNQIVQEAFGEGRWPLEFRAAVARLLTQHAPNDKEAPRATGQRQGTQRLDQTISETMVLDLIVLVGFVVVNNKQLQETVCDGWSAIKTLCTLPANWLVSRPHRDALLPTLVALSEHSAAAAAIASELSTGMLDEYMKSQEAQKVKLVQVIKQGRTKKVKK